MKHFSTLILLAACMFANYSCKKCLPEKVPPVLDLEGNITVKDSSGAKSAFANEPYYKFPPKNAPKPLALIDASGHYHIDTLYQKDNVVWGTGSTNKYYLIGHHPKLKLLDIQLEKNTVDNTGMHRITGKVLNVGKPGSPPIKGAKVYATYLDPGTGDIQEISDTTNGSGAFTLDPGKEFMGPIILQFEYNPVLKIGISSIIDEGTVTVGLDMK